MHALIVDVELSILVTIQLVLVTFTKVVFVLIASIVLSYYAWSNRPHANIRRNEFCDYSPPTEYLLILRQQQATPT